MNFQPKGLAAALWWFSKARIWMASLSGSSKSSGVRSLRWRMLTHYAISALICRAATEADIDPDRVKFLRTVRIIRRRAADPAFPP